MHIYDLLERQAGDIHGSIAIHAPGRVPLTYSRLYSHMAYVTSELNRMGLRRGDRIAVVLPNGPEMAVTFLAVASGASCAPLNPAYREEEFDFYLSDLNAGALIVQDGISPQAVKAAGALEIPVITLSPSTDGEAGIFTLSGTGHPGRSGGAPGKPDDEALVLHTSGTTSKPKIVPLTHANLLASAGYIIETFQLSDRDRCLNVMPLFHIHGLVGATLSTVASGGSVVCTAGFDESSFFRWIEEFGPTWYTAVPTMHQAVLAQAKVNRGIIDRFPLRFIRSCSSPLPPLVMDGLEREFHAPAVESYGMTEASHQIASNPLPPGQRKAGSVGMATGTEVAIMDGEGTILPPGETGEIVVQGRNIMEGYENNPSANENSFARGWLRTGDQGYLDRDGYLFITGRIKEIINRGGRKISPREIDDVLMEHPSIAQVVTFAVPHPTLGEDVATAVIMKKSAPGDEKVIRKYAFSRLADFKVPSKVLIVDDIPKGPTGKLQRIGLAEKLSTQLGADYVAPRTRVERELTEIWCEVLSTERLGVQDNFFMMGGDSLMATRVISRVRDVFGVELAVENAFRTPTISDLSIVIAVHMARGADSESMAEILDDLENLSEEDARKLLEEDVPLSQEREYLPTPSKDT